MARGRPREAGRRPESDAEDFPGTLLPPNAHSVCRSAPRLVLCAVHPQRLDVPIKGNFAASSGEGHCRRKRAIAAADAFVARKRLRRR
jgi:hypothetical protein